MRSRRHAGITQALSLGGRYCCTSRKCANSSYKVCSILDDDFVWLARKGLGTSKTYIERRTQFVRKPDHGPLGADMPQRLPYW